MKRKSDSQTQIDGMVALGNLRRARLQHPSFAGRRLVLVDIENIVGGAVVNKELAAEAKLRLERSIVVGAHDLVVLGVSHIGMLAAGLAWRGVRLVVRSGANGADLALRDVIRFEQINERFDELVLVSGDGIFASDVALLAAKGMTVTVVADKYRCSRRLTAAATQVVFLQDLDGLGDVA